MTQITGNKIHDMVRHWLNTPVNGYLGSRYGQDIKSLLQRPLDSDGEPDIFLHKLRTDVPVLDALPPGSTNLYGITTHPDKLELVLEVAGKGINIADARV